LNSQFKDDHDFYERKWNQLGRKNDAENDKFAKEKEVQFKIKMDAKVNAYECKMRDSMRTTNPE
jgi:hypothetical protein